MNDSGTTRVSAYGLLLRDEKLLLCRLSERVGMNPGSWTLPGGGLDCDSMPGWSPMHSIRIIYRVKYLSGDLQYETDGSTDLCAWHTYSDTQALPLVGLAKVGIAHSYPSPDATA